MRFFSTLVAAALAAVAAAQTSANPFTRSSYSGITAGTATQITWTPTTSGTVTLLLVKGDPSALKTVATIGSESFLFSRSQRIFLP